ncbi:unnamed protein product [Amoebophrya sp. A25]|nr:unnamed protein product [Amoebophrya sp. A25]|eukprot:GSA25T00020053001.1
MLTSSLYTRIIKGTKSPLYYYSLIYFYKTKYKGISIFKKCCASCSHASCNKEILLTLQTERARVGPGWCESENEELGCRCSEGKGGSSRRPTK